MNLLTDLEIIRQKLAVLSRSAEELDPPNFALNDSLWSAERALDRADSELRKTAVSSPSPSGRQ